MMTWVIDQVRDTKVTHEREDKAVCSCHKRHETLSGRTFPPGGGHVNKFNYFNEFLTEILICRIVTPNNKLAREKLSEPSDG